MTEHEFHSQAAKLLQDLADLHRTRARFAQGTSTVDLFTGTGGRIHGLGEQIKELLRQRPGLSTMEIVSALYSRNLGIEKSAFLRRVTVMVSNLNKQRNELTKEGKGRSVRWFVNDSATDAQNEERHLGGGVNEG